MIIHTNNLTESFVGLSIELTTTDLDKLVAELKNLQQSPQQHFHLSNNADSSKPFVDIEISVNPSAEEQSSAISGPAVSPDTN